MEKKSTIFLVLIISCFFVVGCSKPKTYETSFKIPIYYINNSDEKKFIIEDDISYATIDVVSTEQLDLEKGDFKAIINMQDCDLEEEKCIVKLSCETTLDSKKLNIKIHPAQVTIKFIK